MYVISTLLKIAHLFDGGVRIASSFHCSVLLEEWDYFGNSYFQNILS